MKRMYVTLGIVLLVLVWAVSCLGQKESHDTEFDRLKRRMELREEMHRRMRDKLFHGIGPDRDLFRDMDKLFDDAFSDAFAPFDNLDTFSSNFKSEWKESESGRSLIVTPSEDQKLDIDVNAENITIKGKTEHKSEQRSYSSSFSNSFPVPEDCDGSKVKISQEGGNIVIHLPYKKNPSPDKDGRVPLQPSEDDVTI